jgi:hypothetical protein
MQANIGGIERVIRALAGVGLVLFALFSTHPLHNWGWLGVILLATGLIGWCPPYALFGINTCKKR